MKICVVMSGVSRPSTKRIIDNIHHTIAYFRKTYSHTFDFVICTYINDSSREILNYCTSNDIYSYFIDPIKDSDIPNLDKYVYANSPDVKTKNRYRLFYSMNYILSKIPDKYDGVIRLRIDTEIKSFELLKIKPNIYYTVVDTETSCSDNIGYATLEVMKKVWDLKNVYVKAINNETLVMKAILKNAFRIVPFKFNYILYQSKSDSFDNVVQWSKNNRQWIYDGKHYTRGKILTGGI